MKKKTLVLGASQNTDRYSNMAVQKLVAHQHPVVAVGRRAGMIGQVEIVKDQVALQGVDTVSVYLNPLNQKEYYDYILSLHPNRIIFNPGAENEELEELAHKSGINTMEACTLVLLSTGQY